MPFCLPFLPRSAALTVAGVAVLTALTALTAPTAAIAETAGHAAALPLSCEPVAGGQGMVGSSACEYGLPARSGELLLVPKICRTPVGPDLFDRHAVEVRDGRTGARIGQASLPAVQVQPATTLARVGALLGGPEPLYVHAGGIAAIQARAGRAEPVFEAEGRLVGVARHGDVLAVVEAAPANKAFPKGSLEWTVLDAGAGEMLGQLQLAGTDLDGLALRPGPGRSLAAVVERRADGKRVQVLAEVRDAQGKPVARDGALRGKVGPAAALAVEATGTAGCPLVAPAEAVVVAEPRLVAVADGSRRVAGRGATRVQLSDAAECLGVTALDEHGLAFAWLVPAAGKVELRPVQCRQAPRPVAPAAPAVAPKAP